MYLKKTVFFRFNPFKFNFFSSNKLLVLLWLFLLIFPKGGFKLAGIPITWGYLLLGIATFFSFFNKYFFCSTPRIQTSLLMVPFQIAIILSILLEGVASSGFAFSFIFNFFVIPVTFFIFFSKFIESMDLEHFSRLIKKGIFFISAYGIFLFVFKLMTHRFIEIPFLTVSYHDLGELDSKCNNRGFFYKLISTYNNGNIYGICVLMFLPLYMLIEKTKWKSFIVKFSLLLTLSRSVWLGLIFNEIICFLFVSKKTKSSLINILMYPFVVLSAALFFLGRNSFDRDLGGRIDQFEVLNNITLFIRGPLGGVYEIVYLGILNIFGALGLISYLICICGPIVISFFQPLPCHFKRSIWCGLINYLFISFSDGALLYIPVMAFYWFLSSLALRTNLTYDHHKLGSK